LHIEKCLGVPYRRSHLQPVADNPLIAQQSLCFSLVVARDCFRVEPVKGRAIIFALPQNRVPTKPGLRALQNQELEQNAVVMLRDAPFAVVIENREIVACPGAANDSFPSS